MKLESIELRNTGPFTDAVRIGPFSDDLNGLAARNEAGKTTFLMSAARALFDRHNVTGDAIERLQPVGTSLAPDISVIFRTSEGRFKIRKCFLHSPTSELSEDHDGEWRRIADGDAADGRVLDLIGGVRTGRGVSKAEHWGLLRYLWARQGETTDWPAWDDEAGARIRTGLAQVDIDPLVDRLRGRLWEAQAEQFTSTGRVSKNSPLQVAQQALERIEAELIGVRAEMERVDRDVQDLQRLREESAVRAREKAEAEEQAAALTGTLKQVELLQKDLERFQGSFETAQQRLNEIHRDSEALGKAKTGLGEAIGELARKQAEEQREQRDEKEARTALIALQDSARALQKKLDLGRKGESRLREIQELRGLDEDLARLRKRLEAVRGQHHALDTLRRKRAALPDISKRHVTLLEQSEQTLRELTIRAEVVGLRVEMKPHRDATVTIERDGLAETSELRAGRGTTLRAARALRLTLPEWGELEIASGAEEAVELERQIASGRAALDAQLKKLGVGSVEKARTGAEQIKDIELGIKTSELRLTELLEDWDSLDALTAGVGKTEADAEQRRARLDVTAAEAILTQAELKTELATMRAAVGADEKGWLELQESIETQGQRIETFGRAREEASKTANSTKNRIAALESQLETIKGRYPDGIEEAETSAQVAFVETKAQLDVARRKLPADWDKLGVRHERALKAAAVAARDYQELEQRIRRLETLLDHAGSQGLYSRETALVEALAGAKEETGRLEHHALAARFLVGLIDYRKKAAVRTVLRPLEEQLSSTFADVTGEHTRHVFLDENLQIAGIGRRREEAVRFDQLSQGAREQLLLALRAAVALELAKHGPQLLILDDVLVNTDATRQQNVLDFIQNVAQRVQVLIVTCHADRYRGVGNAIGIERLEAAVQS